VGATGAFTGTVNKGIKESVTVDTTTNIGDSTLNYSTSEQQILYFTTTITDNFNVNIRSSGSEALDTYMSVGESLTLVLLVAQGSTPYNLVTLTIDGGSAITPVWAGGTPTTSTANSVMSYTFTVIKTASATFTVLANGVVFA
jgi:hypothetical protein